MDPRNIPINPYRLSALFRDDTIIHTTALVTGKRKMVPSTTWKRERLLGAGGFGMVWLEKERHSQELRAVKVLSKSQLQLREVETMIELRDVSTVTASLEFHH